MNLNRTFAGLCAAGALLAAGAVRAQDAMGGMDMEKSRYGGPVYSGAPALAVTASLVKAGQSGGRQAYQAVRQSQCRLLADRV